jgi:hypothetical protein
VCCFPTIAWEEVGKASAKKISLEGEESDSGKEGRRVCVLQHNQGDVSQSYDISREPLRGSDGAQTTSYSLIELDRFRILCERRFGTIKNIRYGYGGVQADELTSAAAR